MAAHQDDPMHARHLARVRSHHVSTVIGVILIALGYWLVAVTPDTPPDWVLLRVVLGFVSILAGFILAVIPLLGKILSADNQE